MKSQGRSGEKILMQAIKGQKQYDLLITIGM